MKDVSKASLDRMGRLNNAMVEVVNKTKATPIEVVTVLRQLAARIEHCLELSVSVKETRNGG